MQSRKVLKKINLIACLSEELRNYSKKITKHVKVSLSSVLSYHIPQENQQWVKNKHKKYGDNIESVGTQVAYR